MRCRTIQALLMAVSALAVAGCTDNPATSRSDSEQSSPTSSQAPSNGASRSASSDPASTPAPSNSASRPGPSKSTSGAGPLSPSASRAPSSISSAPASSDRPTMPAEARAKTTAGLQAFAAYWLASADYLTSTGDAGPLRSASLPSCEWCEDLAKIYVGMYEAGGQLFGDLDSPISAFQLVGLAGSDRGQVKFRARRPAHIEMTSVTASPRQNEATTLDYTLSATYSGGTWKVDRATWTSV